MFRQILGITIIIAGVIADIALTVSAAAAAHVDLWHYLQLNKLGVFLLDLHYNPALTLLLPLVLIAGFAINLWGRSTTPTRRRY